jgi:hypothetical protein
MAVFKNYQIVMVFPYDNSRETLKQLGLHSPLDYGNPNQRKSGYSFNYLVFPTGLDLDH